MDRPDSGARGARCVPDLGRGVGRRWRARLAAAACAAVAASGLAAVPASAANGELAAAFTGGAGTHSAGGTLFARAGAPLTLTVTAPDDTKCVVVAAELVGDRTSTAPKSVWTFTTTASSGDGLRTFSVSASNRFNANNCTGGGANVTASYVADNTGPVVTAALSPAPNAAGWNRTETTVTWTASDGSLGSGVGEGPTPASTVETADGVVVRTATAKDRLGNTGSGSATVRIDTAPPTISATQTRNPDGSVTVKFVCDDGSGDRHGSGIAGCVADGTGADTVTVDSSRTVTGTATDVAGNHRSTSVDVTAGDTTPPTLSGRPTTEPNDAGWYDDDVTIRWTAADPESGIPDPPADTEITGEGSGLTGTATVANGAGLTTTASSPAVNIDRTAPTTGLTGGSGAWANGEVVLTLAADDNLSGVARTEYAVDGGPLQSGTSVALADEGEHTISYRSIDRAGNVEALNTATVRIDRTAPTIRHLFTPSSYADGAWTNVDVTVTFECADQGGSQVAGCTEPDTRTAEGEHSVVGTARDGAGNTATDTATVRIDKTKPTITAVVSGEPNAAGWYRDDVTVTYTVGDALSGVAHAPDADVLGEGSGQGASGTVVDAAGNSATASVDGVDVDKTPPVLTATVPSGWHTDDVTVTWTCTDALSGPAGQPDDTVVTGEGDDLSATAACSDKAGNTVVTTVSGIRIDRSAPTTTADVPEPLASGWYGTAVRVTLRGSDNLDDSVTTYYRLDDGAAHEYTGPFDVGAEGDHTVSYWSEDAAGNVEDPGAPVVLRIDRTAPTTTVLNPISPDSGWFVTSGIPVELHATDGGSGIATTYFQVDGGPVRTYGEPFTENLSTGTHTLTYWSVDRADNVEEHATTNTIAVNVDTEPPTISGTASPAPNGHGWNNTDVAVTFACDDVGSGLQTGVAGCAGDTVLTNDGADQAVTGDAVDVAGNRSRARVDGINIDQTRPTLVGVPNDPNAAGWYKDDVTVTWVGDDGLSGIDAESQPAPTVVTGEGRELSAGPVTIKDRAGNTSAAATVTGLRIDRTPPVVTGAPTGTPTNGWYRDEVTVDFTCTDNLSGVASCPTSKVVRGDGADQSVTSDPARDVAGNEGPGATVGGISIDGTAPTTTADNHCTSENGWCKGETADVVLTATDQRGLSGVKEIRYRIDGGAEQVAPGAATTVNVPLSGSGAGTVSYYAVDNAGNRERVNAVALKWDNIAPAVSHTLSPRPNAEDWNNSDVTVTFTARDDDTGSGVASVTGPVTVTTETAGRVVTGTARDTAGNVGTDSVTVKLDKTAPVITGAITSGHKTASGWYDGPVTVTFTCSDALSGVAVCPDPVVLSTNGADNRATGTATDRAGNTATASVGGIDIDQEKPTLTTADVNVQGRTFTLGDVPAATCTATDSFSGVASCEVTVSGGNGNGVGTFTYTATATDRAGNRTTVTGTFQVVYRFDGFLQPVNDTAHQVGASTSIFKAGSTVPVKLQLRRSDGTLVQSATAPVWLTPVKGSAMAAPVDETAYAASPDSGSGYRYDATAQQYQYNWKTGAGGNYWRIGVRLEDGQTYYVNIGLR